MNIPEFSTLCYFRYPKCQGPCEQISVGIWIPLLQFLEYIWVLFRADISGHGVTLQRSNRLFRLGRHLVMRWGAGQHLHRCGGSQRPSGEEDHQPVCGQYRPQ